MMYAYEVRLESVTAGKFNHVEHLFGIKDFAINAVNRHVPDGFSCHGLNNNGSVTYAYGQVVDLTTNCIIYRKEREYPQ